MSSSHGFRVALCCLWLYAGACGYSDSNESDLDGGSDAAAMQVADASTDTGDDAAASDASSDAASNTDASDASQGGMDAGVTVTGPGINEGGEIFCLTDQPVLSTAFYFGIQTQCSIYDKKVGTFSAAEKTNWEYNCTSNSGVLVDACPAANRVVYCDGDPTLGGGVVRQTKIVYETTVNPDSATVARNLPSVCAELTGYDAKDDHMLAAHCEGTFKATVDGQEIDFSVKPTCIFKTDGTNMSFYVSGYDDPASPDAKSLTLYVLNDGASFMLKNELGQAGYGYSEGGSGSGAFATPAMGSMPSYTSTTFDMMGASISGTFELGTLTGGGGAQRTITAGTVNLTFDAQ